MLTPSSVTLKERAKFGSLFVIPPVICARTKKQVRIDVLLKPCVPTSMEGRTKQSLFVKVIILLSLANFKSN